MNSARFHPLIPGSTLPNDWCDGRLPDNIVVGRNCVVDSADCFRHYRATGPVGARFGNNVTLWRTSLAVEKDAVIEIGDDCYLAIASLVALARITLGKRVLVAGGATIVDSDFHPIAPASRLADTVALSPVGDRNRRPPVEARPVIVEDGVWIGYHSTILKGVHVGRDAVIAAGAVVTRDVPPGARVAGNPARVVGQVSS